MTSIHFSKLSSIILPLIFSSCATQLSENAAKIPVVYELPSELCTKLMEEQTGSKNLFGDEKNVRIDCEQRERIFTKFRNDSAKKDATQVYASTKDLCSRSVKFQALKCSPWAFQSIEALTPACQDNDAEACFELAHRKSKNALGNGLEEAKHSCAQGFDKGCDLEKRLKAQLEIKQQLLTCLSTGKQEICQTSMSRIVGMALVAEAKGLSSSLCLGQTKSSKRACALASNLSNPAMLVEAVVRGALEGLSAFSDILTGVVGGLPPRK